MVDNFLYRSHVEIVAAELGIDFKVSGRHGKADDHENSQKGRSMDRLKDGQTWGKVETICRGGRQ